MSNPLQELCEADQVSFSLTESDGNLRQEHPFLLCPCNDPCRAGVGWGVECVCGGGRWMVVVVVVGSFNFHFKSPSRQPIATPPFSTFTSRGRDPRPALDRQGVFVAFSNPSPRVKNQIWYEAAGDESL